MMEEPLPPEGEEHQRRAASTWYHHFEAGRRPSRGRGAGHLVRWLLLAVAGLLLVLGFSLRGERFRTLGRTQSATVDWPSLLRTELHLDDADAARLVPMWQEWTAKDDALQSELSRVGEELRELSASRSELNQNQQLALARFRELDSLRFARRHALLDSCQARFGLWRAARLGCLLLRAH